MNLPIKIKLFLDKEWEIIQFDQKLEYFLETNHSDLVGRKINEIFSLEPELVSQLEKWSQNKNSKKITFKINHQKAQENILIKFRVQKSPRLSISLYECRLFIKGEDNNNVSVNDMIRKSVRYNTAEPTIIIDLNSKNIIESNGLFSYQFQNQEKIVADRIIKGLKQLEKNSTKKKITLALPNRNGEEVYIISVKEFLDLEHNWIQAIIFALNEKTVFENKINQLKDILSTVSQIQEETHLIDDTKGPLNKLLKKAIKVVDSEFGFAGEIIQHENNNKLLTKAMIFSSNANFETMGEDIANTIKYNEFGNILNKAINHGKPLIYNRISKKNKSDISKVLKRFLGIPIYKGSEYIAYLGFANKSTDYTEEDIKLIEPLALSYANLIRTIRNLKINQDNKVEKARFENLYQLLAENIEDIILMTDIDLNVLYISPSVEKITEYRVEDFVGKKIYELFSEFPSVPQLHSNQSLVIPVIKKNSKQKILLEFQFKVLKNDEGKVYSILSVSRNVTERENALRRFKEIAYKEKELNQLKSRFISTASHEFRTPLATIMSSTMLLELLFKKDQVPDNKEKIEGHITKIANQTTRLSDIISDIIFMEKSVQNEVEPKFKKVNIKSYLKELITVINRDSNYTNSINFVSEEEGDKQVDIDLHLFGIIIRNLTSNALKYSEKSKIGPEVNLEFKGSYFSIHVKDFGVGIPEEDQKNIFNVFFRANNVSTIKGTGLGLNIVHDLVNKLQGKIEFQSKQNQGTTFSLSLPITQSKTKLK